MRRVALILAGGSGERFWPLSTAEKPKQLLSLLRPDMTLIEQTVRRVEPLFGLDNIWIVASQSLADAISAAVPALGTRLIVEPSRKNTAGAIIWAMCMASSKRQEPMAVAVLPADHRIEPEEELRKNITQALEIAEQKGVIATIGVEPDRPETGYGYIQLGEAMNAAANEVVRFTEKPDKATAESFLQAGSYLWNSGMFFWTEETFRRELALSSPVHHQLYQQICTSTVRGELDKAAAAFEALPSISIDYALLEKSQQVAVVRASFDWDDIGAWDSLARFMPKDEHGNILRGVAVAVDSHNNVIFNCCEGKRVNLLGVHDMVVVVTEDEILICPKDQAQEVRRMANGVTPERPSKI